MFLELSVMISINASSDPSLIIKNINILRAVNTTTKSQKKKSVIVLSESFKIINTDQYVVINHTL